MRPRLVVRFAEERYGFEPIVTVNAFARDTPSGEVRFQTKLARRSNGHTAHKDFGEANHQIRQATMTLLPSALLSANYSERNSPRVRINVRPLRRYVRDQHPWASFSPAGASFSWDRVFLPLREVQLIPLDIVLGQPGFAVVELPSRTVFHRCHPLTFCRYSVQYPGQWISSHEKVDGVTPAAFFRFSDRTLEGRAGGLNFALTIGAQHLCRCRPTVSDSHPSHQMSVHITRPAVPSLGLRRTDRP
jgi:hypothetical protein